MSLADHAEGAPSGAEIWEPCPGAITMQAAFPETEETPEQREGTAAHWAVEQVLRGQLIDVGLIAPNGWVLDQDMCDGAELMRKAIPDRVRPLCRIEQRVRMARRIHPHVWGTPDVWAYDPRDRTVYIWDYKYGHGYVEVIDNRQLMLYAAGVMEELGLDDLETRVVLCIVQPRCWHKTGHVRRWSVPMSDLRAPWNRLMMAAETAFGDDPPINPGSHCRHCRARHACPALHKHVTRIHDLVERAIPLEMPDDALAFEIRDRRRLRDLLDAQLTGLEADAETRLRAGKRLQGMALETGVSALQWTAPAATVIGLGRIYGLDLAKPAAPITPTQARAKGLPEEVLKGAARRETTAAKLVMSDPMAMRRIFNGGDA